MGETFSLVSSFELSCSGVCVGLITRPEMSYRIRCFWI